MTQRASDCRRTDVVDDFLRPNRIGRENNVTFNCNDNASWHCGFGFVRVFFFLSSHYFFFSWPVRLTLPYIRVYIIHEHSKNVTHVESFAYRTIAYAISSWSRIVIAVGTRPYYYNKNDCNSERKKKKNRRRSRVLRPVAFSFTHKLRGFFADFSFRNDLPFRFPRRVRIFNVLSTHNCVIITSVYRPRSPPRRTPSSSATPRDVIYSDRMYLSFNS